MTSESVPVCVPIEPGSPSPPLAGLFDWWGKLWSAPRYWWSLEIVNRGNDFSVYSGPRNLTTREATEWYIDALEGNWNSEVHRLRWDGSAWVYS